MSDTATSRLLSFLPYFRHALRTAQERCKEGDEVQFAAIVQRTDGSGELVVHFSAHSFLNDLAEALGEDPATVEEGIIKAKAEEIVQLFTTRGKKA